MLPINETLFDARSRTAILPPYLTQLFEAELLNTPPKYDKIGKQEIPKFLVYSKKLTQSAKFAVKENLLEICNQLYQDIVPRIWQWVYILYGKKPAQKTEFRFESIGDEYTTKLLCRYAAVKLALVADQIYQTFLVFLQRVTEVSLGVLEAENSVKASFFLLLWSDKMQYAIYERHRFQAECEEFASSMAAFLRQQPKTKRWTDSVLLQQLGALGVFDNLLDVYAEAVYVWLPSVLDQFQEIEVLAAWYDRLSFAAPMIAKIQPFFIENCHFKLDKADPLMAKFSERIRENVTTGPILSIDDYNFLVDCLTHLHDEKDIPDIERLTKMLFDRTGYDTETLYLILFGLHESYDWTPLKESGIGVSLQDVETEITKIVNELRLRRQALSEWEFRNGIDRSEQESFGIKLVELYIQENYKKYTRFDDWEQDEQLKRLRDSYLPIFSIGRNDSEVEKQDKKAKFGSFVDIVAGIQKLEIERQEKERQKRTLQPVRARTRAMILDEIQGAKQDVITVLSEIAQISNNIDLESDLFKRFYKWVIEDGGYRFFQSNILSVFKTEITKFSFTTLLTDTEIMGLMIQMGELHGLHLKNLSLAVEFEQFMTKRMRFTAFYFLIICLVTGYIFNAAYNLIPAVIVHPPDWSVYGVVTYVGGGALNLIKSDLSNTVGSVARGMWSAVFGGVSFDISLISPANIVSSFLSGDIGRMEFFTFYFTSVMPILLNVLAISYIAILTGARALTDVTTEGRGNIAQHYSDARNLIQPRMRELGANYGILIAALHERNQTMIRGVLSAIPMLQMGPVGMLTGTLGIYNAVRQPGARTNRMLEDSMAYLRARTQQPRGSIMLPEIQREQEHVNNLIENGPRVQVLEDRDVNEGAIVRVDPDEEAWESL